MKTEKLKLKDIKPNPDNPRVIRDWQFEKLKKSIQDFPQMLEIRPIVVDENNIILGGNQTELYKGNAPIKNLLKAKTLEAVWPQYVKTVIRFNRHHHYVDWKVFKKNGTR